MLISKPPTNDFSRPGVYLLHFDTPYRHAQHYLGASYNIYRRVRSHRRGQSRAKLVMAVHAAGIYMDLARIWPTTTEQEAYHLEIELKRWHNNRLLCPICHPRPTEDIPF